MTDRTYRPWRKIKIRKSNAHDVFSSTVLVVWLRLFRMPLLKNFRLLIPHRNTYVANRYLLFVIEPDTGEHQRRANQRLFQLSVKNEPSRIGFRR